MSLTHDKEKGLNQSCCRTGAEFMHNISVLEAVKSFSQHIFKVICAFLLWLLVFCSVLG